MAKYLKTEEGYKNASDICYSKEETDNKFLTAEKVDNAILSTTLFTYTVSNIEGATYGFALNDNGYYESQNKGKAGSYAICRVDIDVPEKCDVVFDVINYAEANYDYAVFGTIDKELVRNAANTTTNVKETLKGKSSASVINVIYSNVSAGSHFIEIKFIKDGSGNNNNDSAQFKLIDNNSELQKILRNTLKVDTAGNSFVSGKIYTGTTTTSSNNQLLNRSEVQSLVSTSVSSAVSSASTKLQSAIDKKLDGTIAELVYTSEPYGNTARFTVNSADDEITLVNNTNGDVYYYGVDINGNEFINCSFGCHAGERTTTTLNELYYYHNGSYMSNPYGPFYLGFNLDYSMGDEGTVSFYASSKHLEAKDLITLPVLQEKQYTVISKSDINEQKTYNITLTETNVKTGIFCTAANSEAHLYITLKTADGRLFANDPSFADISVYLTYEGNKQNVLDCGILDNLTGTEAEKLASIVGCTLEIHEYGFNDGSDCGVSRIEYINSPEIKATKQTLLEMEIEWEDENEGTSIFKLIGVE